MKTLGEKNSQLDAASECPIIPRPQSVRMLQGFFLLKDGKTSLSGTASHDQIRDFALELEGETGLRPREGRDDGKGGAIRLLVVEKLAVAGGHEEGYELVVRPDVVEVRASTDAGLFYGRQSLLGLLRMRDGAWSLPCCEIRDWPDFAWRGVMLDPARSFVPVEQVRQCVDLMARGKMNRLHMHLCDSEKLAVESKLFPALNQHCYHHHMHDSYPALELFPDMRPYWLCKPYTLEDLRRMEAQKAGFYTHAEIRELVAYAAARHVEIIPEIDMPGHAANFVRAFPELRCHVPGGHGSLGVPCLGNEATYRTYEQLVDELAPLFPSRIFHIGGDEVENTKRDPESRLVHAQTWDKCETCRAYMKEKGLADIRSLYYHFVARMHGRLARHGKRMMMWNDEIDIGKGKMVPYDVLIHFWRVAIPGCGPTKNCSFKKFLDAGYEVVNSHYLETYLGCDVHDKKLLTWHPAKRPPSSKDRRSLVQGGELCAWGWYDHYRRALPTSIAVFGDRLWNKRAVGDVEEHSRHVARHLFGPRLNPGLLDIFKWCGSIIPPMWTVENRRTHEPKDMIMPQTALKSKSECEAAEKLIRAQLEEKGVSRPELLREYLLAVGELGKARLSP